jgi:hypothetical protein
VIMVYNYNLLTKLGGRVFPGVEQPITDVSAAGAAAAPARGLPSRLAADHEELLAKQPPEHWQPQVRPGHPR